MVGMTRRLAVIGTVGVALAVGAPAAAFACGGLVAPGHAEVLGKATTLAAWHAGLEHYVTAFQFAGTAAKFGYIIPLPGNPSKIEKGGDWTLERLEREVNPPVPQRLALAAGAPAFAPVQVLQKVQIEALDITVVKGGGRDVAAWASRNGFDLTPDAPRVLGAYSSSGAIFALAKFDRTAAARRGLIEGQGSTIHFTIPTTGPWIPLRILALGKVSVELVDADLFVLTDRPPVLAPSLDRMPGMTVRASRWAGPSLLHDLRSDRGMGWVPRNLWLTSLQLHAHAHQIGYDLSIDGAAPRTALSVAAQTATPVWVWALTAVVILSTLGLTWVLWRPRRAGLQVA